ncbi:DegT/DnrJ/EryC1/StrS family aminotransferase [Amycolatopsis sp., V23-08]|uniref:DegT/DnrJ/EryC1/StrS family aminotransferase n=1 Tax=Amycolatopsis heterodermiae TaxID=3110235 RepID=A0ABU5RLX5_9PSEU|nr:DegT/DnrJ/EryC1/StrS family aminotransferase [Amycolatopsis sp., V23-08]MEA5367297.1 DegT/DnrJ/EryC1/StrS family aminotransferase [Amycolatopsis sp., V23-08]
MVEPSNAPFGRLEMAAVQDVLNSGRLWRGNGPGWGSEQDSIATIAAERLEDAIAQRLGIPYVHVVNSGTSANEAAIASLGLEPGSEVICPAVSPVFVPLAILAAGCIPVFADVDPETLIIDPCGIEAVVSDNTKALIVIHLWGMPAPIKSIIDVAMNCGLYVVEDCAQAFGTVIENQPVGTFGDACSYSFQQSKHITSGEGGFFASHNAERYARAVLYSNAGIPSFRFGVSSTGAAATSDTRGHLGFGHNHRISELQAAVAHAQLSRLDSFIRRRAELVTLVDAELQDKGNDSLRTPRPVPGHLPSYWRYPVLVPPGKGTFTGISYLEPVFQQMNDQRRTPFGISLPPHVRYDRGTCPAAEGGVMQIRAVPIHHSLTDNELRKMLRGQFEDL